MNYSLFELAAVHSFLILAFFFILRKERQYAKMRLYLVGATALAILIPFLKLPKLFVNQETLISVLPMAAGPYDTLTTTHQAESSFWQVDMLLWVWVFISVPLLLRILIGVIRIIRLERRSTFEFFNGKCIRRASDIGGSFTFFNWIFLSHEIDKNQDEYHVILKHEEAHASLGHTFDLLFFELFRACFWWMPSAWYINQEIKKIHEYQADEYALRTYHVDLYSSILISSTLKSNGLSMASSFHDGLIFKRLKAMKQTTKNVSLCKLATLTVLSTLLFVVFACSEEKNNGDLVSTQEPLGHKGTLQIEEQGGELFEVVEQMPAPAGGMEQLYKYIMSEIKYPLEARDKNIEGKVFVQFVVEKDGTISNVEAVKGIGYGCDDEAMRVVKNAPKFIPGEQRGKKVRTRLVLPIQFKLAPEKTNQDKSAQGSVIIGKADVNNGTLDVEARYVDGEWKGIVKSPAGDEMAGANIVVAGTNNGTVSDLDGSFSVKADKNQDIHVSFVGYKGVVLKAEN